ncbi:DUF2498 family protein [Pseudomonas tohonis]|uniref:DUF2498 family protein n=1 Tax=Pseudomonas tohonis TaxID=2725477 RepID=UPI0022F06EB5|nr:DUF2498 family protein [Pseudomonas tohonis]
MKRVSKQEMVAIANERLRPHLQAIPGLIIGDAETMGTILVLRGECFLSEDGSANEKSIEAIQIYRQLAEELAKEYVVIPE